MSQRVLQTKRLKLRPQGPHDAPDIARLIDNWNVMRWLTSPPWPYTLADAEQYLNAPMSGDTLAIEFDGQFVGSVGLHPRAEDPDFELGFWLAEPFWGQGIMTEAVTAVVADYFAGTEAPIESGYILGNAPSANVLAKLGFRNTERVSRFAVPHDKKMPLQRMELTFDNWRAHHAT